MTNADDRRHRRPRFERTTPPAFQLTERDVAIIRAVARHRLLRSIHVSIILGAPHKKVCDRLTRLYHAGYLDRPRAQIAYYVAGGGSTPMAYALSARGARLLLERGDATPIHVVAADSKQPYLLHALAVADFRIRLRAALLARPDIRLIDDEALPASPATPVHVAVAGDAVVATVPDYVFALHRADGAVRNYAVEIDRGTMPITRASLTQSSVMRKVVAYAAIKEQGLYRQQFGWRNFRVLIVTDDAKRAANMRSAVAPSLMASLVLVADAAAIAPDPLAGWSDCAGNKHTLL